MKYTREQRLDIAQKHMGNDDNCRSSRQAISESVRKFGGNALTRTFMPRKPLDDERKAWQPGRPLICRCFHFQRLQRLIVKRIAE